MAHIVPFKSAAMRDAEEAGRSGGAQIVIFPGVRRERHAEPEAARPPDANRPARDWLELTDELPPPGLS
jgi:hypothetical protein